MRDISSKVIAIALLVLVGLGLLSACQGRRSADMPPEVATLDKPAVSPSGRFILVVLAQNVDGQDVQSFQILSADKTTLYTPSEQFTARDMNFFLWDASDRVWVYSGDLGTFFWENQGEPQMWKKYVYVESDVPAPPFLKEVRPRWHQK